MNPLIVNDQEVIAQLQKQKLEYQQSIQYASYIQKALLPKQSEMDFLFPEHFIYYKPRDVVSGDFYWVYRDKSRTLIALADCTGHGVPGAFLSILGISFLNLVTSKHKPDTAAEILNHIREYVMRALNQSGAEREQKDGLDMALCIIDNKTRNLQFSGAFNSLYVVRGGVLTQIDGDKMPIGVAAEYEESFTNKVYDLQTGDMLYLFTDGYPDQFGGIKGKKYKYHKFRELLVKASKKNMKQQNTFITADFNNWKGDLPQLDDVTIIGIRVTKEFLS